MTTNPKDKFGDSKPSLALMPESGLVAAAGAFELGARKYGAFNWQEHDVSAMVYCNAIMRHLQAWKEDEDIAPDSGVSHLGHIIACASILLDAQANHNFDDDRPKAFFNTVT